MKTTTLPSVHSRRRMAWLPLAVLLAAGGLVLRLNLLTPLIADDYYYACRLTVGGDGLLVLERRLAGLGDLLASQKSIYTAHSGRLPVLAAVQLSTLLPAEVFDLLNTAVFLALLALLVHLARPASPGAAAGGLALAFLLLWCATPAFGQDFLWQTGAVNYLWTITVTLAFLTPYLFPYATPHRGAAGWFFLGLLSGWSMENQSAAACALCLARLAIFAGRRRRPPLYLAAGAVGQLLGAALLLLAPGNRRRSAGYGQGGVAVSQALARLWPYTRALLAELWWLVLLAFAGIFLAVLAARRGGDSTPPWAAGWLLAGAALCHFSMAVSPIYPLRSMLGTEVFLIAAALCGFCRGIRAACGFRALLCGVLYAGFLLLLPVAWGDLSALHTLAVNRAWRLSAAHAGGQASVTLPVAAAATRFNPLWGDALSDLMQNPTNERNVSLALYYGVPAVVGDPNA